MKSSARWTFATGALLFLTLPADAQTPPRIAIDKDDIGGVVTSVSGPEAGVWVIAETDDLQTKFRKIVVTDDRGRFVLPDLPQANYKIWVRGYGLVDSMPVHSAPGKTLALTAVKAPDARAAAQYYPANYWYSLMQIPAKSEFPGTGPQGNGIDPEMKTQDHWINQIKVNCNVCHQMGNKATREIPSVFSNLSSIDAWDRRVQTGQDGKGMSQTVSAMGRDRALKMFADWTDRIKAGEVPRQPPRPQGIERNIVLTLWDWGGPATFAHDELSSDKWNATKNPNGTIYGVDWGNDAFLMIDPVKNTASQVRVPVLDPQIPAAKAQTMPVPSPYWGEEIYWFDPANPNHLAMDPKGRIWITARFRKDKDQPAYCKDNPYWKLAPLDSSYRQIEYYDPTTKQFHQVNTCFAAHHIQFGTDPDVTFYANDGMNGTLGWVKTRVLEQTGDVNLAQGWCKGFLDINGDGKFDASIDKPLDLRGLYSVIPNNADGSMWGAVPGPVPGRIVRMDPKTCAAETYEPPFNNPKVSVKGYAPRGIDIDSQGVIWTALAGSGHLASFDRRKCRASGADLLDGQHCAAAWTLYPAPGPRFKGVTDEISVEHHYYNFLDRDGALGLGKDLPMANGTNSDSLLALDRSTGKMMVLRVPYPLGFFQRGMDGRIDDPKGGWKGRGIYADYGENPVWHQEGGIGSKSAVVKFQLRPDPLAK